jgi:hypothetical protein
MLKRVNFFIRISEHPPRPINRHLLVCQVSFGALSRASAGTYPSHQRWFLSVLPTTLARLLLRSQAEREALRSYPTGQVRRKEKGCPYMSYEV